MSRKVKLEEKDKTNIIKFVNKFRSHSAEVRKIEEELNDLLERKNIVLQALEKTRGNEKVFTKALCEKYGAGHFDVLDLNFWVLNE